MLFDVTVIMRRSVSSEKGDSLLPFDCAVKKNPSSSLHICWPRDFRESSCWQQQRKLIGCCIFKMALGNCPKVDNIIGNNFSAP